MTEPDILNAIVSASIIVGAACVVLLATLIAGDIAKFCKRRADIKRRLKP